MIFTILFILILLILIYNYYVHHGKSGKLINLIPGPASYPIFGNILQYLGSREEVWKTLTTQYDQYYPISKIWMFSLPVVFIRHPDDLKTILSNIKHIEKSFVYYSLRPWLGINILTSEGAEWHLRRKMLTPTFHFNILQQFVPILIEEGENMTKTLKNTQSTIVKDLASFTSEYTLNAICETAMGASLRDLGAFQQQYVKAVRQITKLISYRIFRQWLYSDWIFSLTAKGKEQTKVLKLLHGFTNQIIAERKLYHERTNGRYLKTCDNDTLAQTNDTEMIGKQRRRLALLDLLIAASREGLLTDLDIKGEIDAFMFAGHDTTAISLTYLLVLLAEHKNIQDRVRNEVNAAMKETGGKLTMKSLECLSYLEMCIKESLRLYPSASLISRVTGEDVKLQSYLVPAGTTIVLNIYKAHRDPNFWPNPERFDPDRFLPERIQNRHPYSYIPFSAGPRGCMGQRYALLQMKALIAPLIHSFYLEPVDNLKNLRIYFDVVLRPTHPLYIKFIPICKMNENA